MNGIQYFVFLKFWNKVKELRGLCHLSDEPLQCGWRGRIGQRQLDVARQFGDESVGQPVTLVQRCTAEGDAAEGARQRRRGARDVYCVLLVVTLGSFSNTATQKKIERNLIIWAFRIENEK